MTREVGAPTVPSTRHAHERQTRKLNSQGAVMAYCAIIENPDAGQEQFEQLRAYLRETGAFPPDGQRLLIAGPADEGWRVISVWDSVGTLEHFYTDGLPAACRAASVPCDRMTRTSFEVHTIVAGDLTGTPQPA
jgi:hypothetical protein